MNTLAIALLLVVAVEKAPPVEPDACIIDKWVIGDDGTPIKLEDVNKPEDCFPVRDKYE